MWVRGLKPSFFDADSTGMWSHPMWVRGLKLPAGRTSALRVASHPMWVRGLKHLRKGWRGNQPGVAPHVGAWIETLGSKEEEGRHHVAPHVGAWIETAKQ